MLALQVTWIIGLFAISALGGLSAWCIFVWAIKDKQFDDTEDVARRLNELDDATVAAQKPRESEGAKV